MRTIIRGAVLPLAFSVAGTADATVLDFTGLTPNSGFTSAAKDGFTVATLTGPAYASPSTQTFLPVSVGGTTTDPLLLLGQGPRGIEVTDGGLFTLGAFTFTRTTPADNDVQRLTVTGYLNNVAVFSRVYEPASNWPSGVVATPSGGYETILVDRVRFVQDGFHSGTLDNINVSAAASVPEPEAWALMIAGFGAAGAALRRHRAGAARPA